MYQIRYEDGTVEDLAYVKSPEVAKAIARAVRNRTGEKVELYRVTQLDIDAPPVKRGKAAQS